MSVFVCFGDLDECQNCGGSVTLGGDQHPVEDGQGGRYCCRECMEEAHEFNARAKAQWDHLHACCSVCGFDNAEHDEGCSAA